MYGASMGIERADEARAERQETMHFHKTADAMTEPAPRLPRHPGEKQRIDWLALFQEVESGKSCTVVAARYAVGGRQMKADTLQKRLKRWRAAAARGDDVERRLAEGKETGRGQRKRVFTKEEEEELAGRIQAEKGEGGLVDRQYVMDMAVKFYNTLHPVALRSVSTFACSPRWITAFRRRHGFNTSRHKIRPVKPAAPADRTALEDRVAPCSS